MANDQKKFKIIKEQLNTLCASKALKKGEKEFSSFLKEDLQLRDLNAGMLASLCYYTIGMIDIEKRDTLVQWPLVNTQRRTQFRKGVIAMVNDFEKKYPWANIIKVQESYFIQPHGQTSKILDFILRLTNLAIYLFLDDPEILMMQSVKNLSSKEVALMTETVSTARKHEEEIIKKTILPLSDYEGLQNEISVKCIYLTQENDKLQQELAKLHKNATSNGFVKSGTKIEIDDLRKIKDEKLSELNTINEALQKYSEACKEVSSKLKAMENRMSLSAKDFGFETSPVNLSEATSNVCANLYKLFENIKSKSCTKMEANQFCEELKKVQSYLIKENDAYKSFLLKMSSISL